MQGVADSEKLKTGMEVSPKDALANLLRRMGETSIPANRIYEAMRMQLEELRRGFERNGGDHFDEKEQKDLTERIDSVLKLSDIYQQSLKTKGNLSAEEMKQAETVGSIKDAIQGQKLYIKEHAVEKEIEKVKDLTRGYVDTMRKSVEAYMVSQREITAIVNAGGDKLDAPAQDKARIGLAAAVLCNKLADPENGQRFYENFLSSGGDYAKTVQTIASSREFKEATKDLMKPEALKNFAADSKAPGKLWASFEKEMQKGYIRTQGAKPAEAEKKEPAKQMPKM